MNELVFFSNNKNKINEVKKILRNNKIKILSVNNFKKINDPIENGISFSENAAIKSKHAFNNYKLPCFADDSGICIKALNDLPGVKSKRFILEKGGLKETLDFILKETNKTKIFNAYFQTTIALILKKNKIYYFKGIVKGKISKTPLGNNGFAYDKIFVPNGYIKTYAQMSLDEKNKISHRAIALLKLKKFIENLIS